MTESSINSAKKAAKIKHLQACMLEESQYKKSAGFDEIELVNESAAALALSDIDLSTKFLGKSLSAPLMVAPMTGGVELGQTLNLRWAKACEYFNIAFGVGSQRLALVDKNVEQTFSVRKHAPNALIFANLGAAQMVRDFGPEDALKAVAMINADALFIHLNPLQEVCQEKGDGDFSGVLSAIEKCVGHLSRHQIPVFVREVGFGLSESSARRLIDTGIAGIDCAGAGGTSWTKVEAMCADSESYRQVGQAFGEWGIKSAQSIKNVRAVAKDIPLIACGGIRSGLDAAKALALGANLPAMAQPMLVSAMAGEEQLFSFVAQVIDQLRIAMFACGAKNIAELPSKIG